MCQCKYESGLIDLPGNRIRYSCQEQAREDDPYGFCIFHCEKNNENTPHFKMAFEEYISRGLEEFSAFDVFEGNEIRFPFKIMNFIGFNFPDKTSFEREHFQHRVYFNYSKFGNDTNFIGSVFKELANFSDVEFAGKSLFLNVHFEKRALFINTIFSDRADFLRANFYGAGSFFGASFIKGSSFFQAHLNNVTLMKVNLRATCLREADLSKTNVTGVKFEKNTLKAMKNMPCKGINASTCYGNPIFKRFVEDQDYLEHKMESKWWKYFVFPFWWLTSDCGRSMKRWVFWSIAIAVTFAFVFMGIQDDILINEKSELAKDDFWTYLYYSAVTFTTLGFGDILPKTRDAAMIVMSEVIIGYIMLGGLISIFANKIARRS